MAKRRAQRKSKQTHEKRVKNKMPRRLKKKPGRPKKIPGQPKRSSPVTGSSLSVRERIPGEVKIKKMEKEYLKVQGKPQGKPILDQALKFCQKKRNALEKRAERMSRALQVGIYRADQKKYRKSYSKPELNKVNNQISFWIDKFKIIEHELKEQYA